MFLYDFIWFSYDYLILYDFIVFLLDFFYDFHMVLYDFDVILYDFHMAARQNPVTTDLSEVPKEASKTYIYIYIYTASSHFGSSRRLGDPGTVGSVRPAVPFGVLSLQSTLCLSLVRLFADIQNGLPANRSQSSTPT